MERQLGNPKVAETDQFYLWIALRLAKLWDESPWLRGLDDTVRRDVGCRRRWLVAVIHETAQQVERSSGATLWPQRAVYRL